MSSEKVKKDSFTSPKGIAKYPKIIKPDTKFKADGEYSVKLIINGEYCQELCDKLTAIRDARFPDCEKREREAALKAKKPFKPLKQADLPWKECVDDEGNPTGELEFNFKMPARITKKDGTILELRPAIFDAKGIPIIGQAREELRIGGGSTLRVSFDVRDYYTPLVGFGIKLSLKAVQILKLVEWTGGGTADSHGFEAEEDGFEAPQAGAGAGGEAEAEAEAAPAEGEAVAAGKATNGKASDF